MRHAVMVMLVAIACGPGSAQIQTARAAEYKAPVATIFALAKTVATETYSLGEEQPKQHSFTTARQLYNKDGGRQSTGAGDTVRVAVGSVQLRLRVEVADAGLQRVKVTVTPLVLQVVPGSPLPRELAEGDPNMPPWVGGRVDALTVAIYERAKHFIVQP